MHIEFHRINHGKNERIEVEDMTLEGIHEAQYQCTQMLEELETGAKEALDAEDADEVEAVYFEHSLYV